MNTNSTLLHSRKMLPAYPGQCNFYHSHIKIHKKKWAQGLKEVFPSSKYLWFYPCLTYIVHSHNFSIASTIVQGGKVFSIPLWDLFLFLSVVEINCTSTAQVPVLSLAIFMNTFIFLQLLVSRGDLCWHSARISLNIHHCLLNKKKISCFVLTSWIPLDGENGHVLRLLIRCPPTHLTFLPNILVNDQHWLDHIALEITFGVEVLHFYSGPVHLGFPVDVKFGCCWP